MQITRFGVTASALPSLDTGTELAASPTKRAASERTQFQRGTERSGRGWNGPVNASLLKAMNTADHQSPVDFGGQRDRVDHEPDTEPPALSRGPVDPPDKGGGGGPGSTGLPDPPAKPLEGLYRGIEFASEIKSQEGAYPWAGDHAAHAVFRDLAIGGVPPQHIDRVRILGNRSFPEVRDALQHLYQETEFRKIDSLHQILDQLDQANGRYPRGLLVGKGPGDNPVCYNVVRVEEGQVLFIEASRSIRMHPLDAFSFWSIYEILHGDEDAETYFMATAHNDRSLYRGDQKTGSL